MSNTRIGIIQVPKVLTVESPQQIVSAFAQIGFLPVRINEEMMLGVVEYVGQCSSFDGVMLGHLIPKYQVYFHDDGGKATVSRLEQ